MSDWQPIETAPKGTGDLNGPEILLWWDAYRYNVDDDDPEPIMAIGWWKWNPRTKCGYFSDNQRFDDYGLAESPPTHWMPLPDPPTGEQP